jgi:thioredoxin reductase (NADPH)
MAAQFTLLSREYCHLCHDMLEELRLMQVRFSFGLEVIDVDGDVALDERYGEWVPVLLAGNREICHYHLDRSALESYLKERESPCS